MVDEQVGISKEKGHSFGATESGSTDPVEEILVKITWFAKVIDLSHRHNWMKMELNLEDSQPFMSLHLIINPSVI